MHNPIDDLNIVTTRHASKRLAQRNICLEALALLTLYGIDGPAGDGRVRRELRNHQVGDLHAEGLSLQIIDRALRLEAIYSAEDILITCYQRTPRLPFRPRAKDSRILYRSKQSQGGEE